MNFLPGQVFGRDFLGTRVVLYRDAAGKIVVHSAWCPHLGADLSVGALVDGQLCCAYHHWRFDAAGACVHIPAGDKIPPGAKIATLPSAEAWGLVWVFNGDGAGLRPAATSRASPKRNWRSRRIGAARATPIPGSRCRTASTSSICGRCTDSLAR